MPAPLPLALRRRVTEALEEADGTVRAVAARFKVGTATVKRLSRLLRSKGSLDPLPMGGDRLSKVGPEDMERLKRVVEDLPDATIAELTAEYTRRHGVNLSTSAMSRALERAGITRKKKSFVSQERDRSRIADQRDAFRESQKVLTPEDCLFLDECGVNTSMARTHARAMAGERADAKKPAAKGKNITVIGALGLTGMIGVHSLVGGMKKADFVAYLRDKLFPLMRRGQALVMDNLRSHHSKEVRALAVDFGIQLIFIPAYSPEMNPIEEAWSKMKSCLRSMAARTATKVMDAVQAAARAITAKDSIGWVRHAGYPI